MIIVSTGIIRAPPLDHFHGLKANNKVSKRVGSIKILVLTKKYSAGLSQEAFIGRSPDLQLKPLKIAF